MKAPLNSKHVKTGATIIASLFVLFSSALSLSDYWNQNQLHIGGGSPVLTSLLRPDMSIRVCYHAQGYLSSVLVTPPTFRTPSESQTGT